MQASSDAGVHYQRCAVTHAVQVVEYIHRNYVNPDTKGPYSTALITSALAEVKFTPVSHQSPERQVPTR